MGNNPEDLQHETNISEPVVLKKNENDPSKKNNVTPPKETGGGKHPNPTRYGDWEIAGKCVDF